MTKRDLAKYFEAYQEMKKLASLLDAMRSRAIPGAQSLTGMPHKSGVTDKVGDVAVLVADVSGEYDKIKRSVERMAPKVEMFICGIKDVRLRTIFRLRYQAFMSWSELAETIGDDDEGNARKAINRYFSKH